MDITAELLERMLLKAFTDTVEDTTAPSNTDAPFIRQALSFKDAGRPTNDHGLVLRFTNGTEARITITIAHTTN